MKMPSLDHIIVIITTDVNLKSLLKTNNTTLYDTAARRAVLANIQK